jgi:hypothetical protein
MISEIARRPPQTVCTPPFTLILRTIVPFSEIAEWNSARQDLYVDWRLLGSFELSVSMS